MTGVCGEEFPPADTGNAVAVAAIMHLLILLPGFPQLTASVRDKLAGQPIGQTLAGKTVTILGTGATGQARLTHNNVSSPRTSAA